MTWLAIFAAGFILGGIFGLVVFAWIFGTRKEGAAEAKAEAREQTIAAVQKAAEADRKATERMADAQAASVGEPVSATVERMRKRPTSTR